MPDGGELKISLETIPNRRVRITVEDNGKGMSPEQVEQLFEPFSNSTSGGTGLGLSIVYQIIRDHNGTISVRSSEGEGTAITIELPREKSPTITPVEPVETDSPAPIKQFLKVKPEESKVSS
jgi:signal transduction histidine kinase